MITAELALRKLQELPAEKQREVLELIERLEAANVKSAPRIDPEGILADIQADLSLDDFLKNRREMWGNATNGEV